MENHLGHHLNMKKLEDSSRNSCPDMPRPSGQPVPIHDPKGSLGRHLNRSHQSAATTFCPSEEQGAYAGIGSAARQHNHQLQACWNRHSTILGCVEGRAAGRDRHSSRIYPLLSILGCIYVSLQEGSVQRGQSMSCLPDVTGFKGCLLDQRDGSKLSHFRC